jgi:hypothetical protein
MAINIDGNGLITLGGTASTQGRVRLSEDTDNGTNYIELTAPASVASDKTITFPDATGTVVISGTTPSLNGITFPATQVASADANTLDDYEEGTFTPDLKFGGNAVSLTYDSRGGRYTKIGRCVTVSFYFVLSNKGSSSGVATVSLPFSSDEYGQPNQPGYSGGLATYGSMNTASKAGFIVGNIGAAGYINADSSSTAASVATETNFNNNTSFIVTITYNTST